MQMKYILEQPMAEYTVELYIYRNQKLIFCIFLCINLQIADKLTDLFSKNEETSSWNRLVIM